MAQILRQAPSYKFSKQLDFQWDTFSKGLNTLLRPNEIDKSELSQADNIMLIGRGVPTKRWGLDTYFQSAATGSVRGLEGFYKSDGTNELLALTDQGVLTKENSGSFSIVDGASWASGMDAQMAQLDNTMYIVNGQRPLTKYSSPTLLSFATLERPVITGATNISNATGFTVRGYKVSAVSQVGETLASETFQLINQPETLGGVAGGVVRITWTGTSAASGVLKGYNIYGRDSGNETFLAGANASTLSYDDDGSSEPAIYTYPPTADSTGGIVAKYVIRFQDRLIYAGIRGEPSMIAISGRWSANGNHEKTDLANGGNYLKIEPDAGDDITGIGAFGDRIIVFKSRSIWQVTLNSEQIGNFFVTTPSLKLITAARGCISAKSIAFVENDVFFLSEGGVHSLGYQSGYAIDQLRANEVSGKIRPSIEAIPIDQRMKATATYFDYKYFISFPGSEKTYVFDVRRSAWTGPMSFDANIMKTYVDTTGERHLVIGRSNGPNVDESASTMTNDNGTTITTTLSSRKEDFGDWSLFKTIKSIFLQFKNVTGTVQVDIKLETREGSTLTAASLNITPTTGISGWGADLWGDALWGSTNSAAALTGADTSDIIRWASLNKTGRTVQITVKTNNTNDSYELLGLKGEARTIGSGFRPLSWRAS